MVIFNHNPVSNDFTADNNWLEQKMAWLWLAIIIAALSFGTVLRTEHISQRGLEYDEVWTFMNYASTSSPGRTLTDLATPNNHPLHSLAVAWSTSRLGDNHLAIRLPALLSGLLLIAVMTMIVQLLCRNLAATAYAASLISLNGMLVHYSQTARGYSLQMLTIACFILFLLLYQDNQDKQSGKRQAIIAGLAMASAIAAILTIPTSILYLIPAGLAHGLISLGGGWSRNRLKQRSGTRLIINWMSRNRELAIAYLLIGLFSITWYTVNYQQLTEARSFGEPISARLELFTFTFSALSELAPYRYLALPLPGIIFGYHRKSGLIWTSLAILPFFSALAVGAGPARVYLPSLLFLTVAGSWGITTISELGRRKGKTIEWSIAGLLLAIPVSLFFQARPDLQEQTPIDWKIRIPQLTGQFAETVYLSYPAAANYPILFNNHPEIIIDTFSRSTSLGEYWLQIETPGHIEGTNLEGRTSRLSLENYSASNNFRLFDLEADLYQLQEIRATPGMTDVAIALGPLPIQSGIQTLGFLLSQKNHSWIRINSWIADAFRFNQETEPVTMEVLFTNNFRLDSEQQNWIDQATGGKVRYFKLIPVAVTAGHKP